MYFVCPVFQKSTFFHDQSEDMTKETPKYC